MNGCRRSRVTRSPFTRPATVPTPTAARVASEEPALALLRGDHAAQQGDAADREVDAAGHDHQSHAQRDEGVLGVVGEHGLGVEPGRELVAVPQCAEGEQRGEDDGDDRALALQCRDDPGTADAGARRGGGRRG